MTTHPPHPDHPEDDQVNPAADERAGPAEGADDEVAPEMTPRLLGRLFLVPLLIVIMLVGASAAVVLLFGWITRPAEVSIPALVSRIEAGSGEKVLGVMMLPRDREVWQAAMDLSRRLESIDEQELPPQMRPEIARRLGEVLAKSRAGSQQDMGREMQRFLLLALGRLRQPESVEVLVAYATDASQPVEVRQDAMSALVLMRDQDAAKNAVQALTPLLESPEPVIRIVATVAIGALATRDDAAVIEALSRASASNDREVVWNATLALARLGSERAVPGLMDMLDRGYWDKIRTKGIGGAEGQALSAQAKDAYLILAIEAAGALGAGALRPSVEALAKDASLPVQDQARKALEQWGRESSPVHGTASTAPAEAKATP